MTTPVRPQEIEAIRASRRMVLSPIGKHKNETVILASDFDTLLRAIDERDATIARIQSAAKMGMDAAGAIAHANLQRAERLNAESRPEAIDSERAANALLTEECERLREALAWSIKSGAKDNLVDGLRDSGCGCCSANIEPPAHLRAVLEAARSGK
jgi:hypothetical protein